MKTRTYDKQGLYVGDGVTIRGEVHTEGTVVIHGCILGDIRAKEVHIAASGCVEGTIRANHLDISGKAGNSVTIYDRLNIRATGWINGNVCYGSIQIDSGAKITGKLRQNIEKDYTNGEQAVTSISHGELIDDPVMRVDD